MCYRKTTNNITFSVKSVQPWIWTGRVEGHSCEFCFTLRCMITLHWYLGHYTCCSATSVNVRKSSKLSSRSASCNFHCAGWRLSPCIW